FPYSFEVSKHAVVVTYTSDNAEPYWISIRYPAFEAEIQLTYKPVKQDLKLLREYYDDAYRLTAKHQVKAYSIQEKVLKTPQGHAVVVAELYGEIPSPIQFHTTDTAQHFLRGALYFNTATQNDYLAPIIDFIKEDITHLIYTLTWEQSAH
ncbi:MAG: gliding motility lipoprotein GldD, partial [Bacteroidota bacterium]